MSLALDDLKRKGVALQVIRQDDTGKPAVAMSALEQLATGDEVAAIVGPSSSAPANAMAKLAEQYKVPMLVPVASKEAVTRQGYEWVFRLGAPAHDYADDLIDAALAFGKPRTIAFIYESTDLGTSVATLGKEHAKRKGLQIVGDEAHQKGAADYRSTLTRLRAASPDLVLMVSCVADAVLLVRQSREVGLKPQAFLGGGAGSTRRSSRTRRTSRTTSSASPSGRRTTARRARPTSRGGTSSGSGGAPPTTPPPPASR